MSLGGDDGNSRKHEKYKDLNNNPVLSSIISTLTALFFNSHPHSERKF